MKTCLMIGIIFCSILLSCKTKNDDRYVLFLHNRFLETHQLNESHAEYGRMEYMEIIEKFKNSGLKVLSEKRNGNKNAKEFAIGIVTQIDSLIKNGIDPKK